MHSQNISSAVSKRTFQVPNMNQNETQNHDKVIWQQRPKSVEGRCALQKNELARQHFEHKQLCFTLTTRMYRLTANSNSQLKHEAISWVPQHYSAFYQIITLYWIQSGSFNACDYQKTALVS